MSKTITVNKKNGFVIRCECDELVRLDHYALSTVDAAIPLLPVITALSIEYKGECKCGIGYTSGISIYERQADGKMKEIIDGTDGSGAGHDANQTSPAVDSSVGGDGVPSRS